MGLAGMAASWIGGVLLIDNGRKRKTERARTTRRKVDSKCNRLVHSIGMVAATLDTNTWHGSMRKVAAPITRDEGYDEGGPGPETLNARYGRRRETAGTGRKKPVTKHRKKCIIQQGGIHDL